MHFLVSRKSLYFIIVVVGFGFIATTEFTFANPTVSDEDLPTKPELTLHEAVERGDLKTVNNLLAEKDVNLNELNADEETPLQLASKLGYAEIVSEIIKIADKRSQLGQVVNACHPVSKWTALFYATNSSSSNAEKIASLLLQDGKANPEVRDSEFGRQAIHIAVVKNQTAIVSDLLREDSTLASSACCGGKTPNHLAAKYNVVNYPRDNFNGSALDSLGQTPACYAAQTGSVEFAEAMSSAHSPLKPLEGSCLYGGSNLTIIGTPLHVAVYNRRRRYFDFLLDHHLGQTSLLDFRAEHKETLMHALARPLPPGIDRNNVAKAEKDMAIRMCDSEKSIVKERNSNGRTPFLVAIASSATKLAEILRVECSSAPEVTDLKGYYALHLARDSVTIDYLLNMAKTYKMLKFDDINLRSAREDEELTPLHVAVLEKKPISFVTFLINHKADPKITDRKNGSTALHMAIETDYREAVEEILTRKPFLPVLAIREKKTNLTPLLLAIRKDSVEIAKVIINSLTVEMMGNEVVLEGKRQTAFHLAAEMDRHQIVEAMIDRFYKSKPNWIRNLRDETVLHTAVYHDALRAVNVIVDKVSQESLKEAVSMRDAYGRTVIHALATKCSNKSLEIARLLVNELNFDDKTAQTRDIFSETPLETAVKRNCIPMVELFLAKSSSQQCAVKNERDGLTALHLAKLMGFDLMVDRMVVTGKCSLDQQDERKVSVREVDPKKKGRLSVKINVSRGWIWI